MVKMNDKMENAIFNTIAIGIAFLLIVIFIGTVSFISQDDIVSASRLGIITKTELISEDIGGGEAKTRIYVGDLEILIMGQPIIVIGETLTLHQTKSGESYATVGYSKDQLTIY